MKKILRLFLLVPMLALLAAVFATTPASASDNPVSGTKFVADRHEYQAIKMCHNWVTDTYLDGCGTADGNKRYIQDSVSHIYRCTRAGGCPNSGQVLNWNDTDGFYQPRGWNVATNVLYLPTGWKKYKRNDGHWIKVRSCGCWKIIKRYPKG